MIVAVIVLAAATVGLLVMWLVSRRRAARQLAESSAAQRVAAERAAALDSDLASERDTRLAVESERQAALAARDAAAAEAAASRDAAMSARRRAEDSERRAEIANARATQRSAGFDPQLVWALEQARSERLWRLSIALGPDLDSVFLGEPEPLRVALQVEVDAAREEVGAVVELDAELPSTITPAGSVLVLRTAQELLATVVRRGEQTVVRIRPDGRDMLVTVHSVDEHELPVAVGELTIPPSDSYDLIDDGVRIANVVSVGDDPGRGDADDDADDGGEPI